MDGVPIGALAGITLVAERVTEALTDDELAALNLVVATDGDPRGRVFDYEKVRDLFDQAGGLRMHELTKAVLGGVVSRRLGDGGGAL